MPDTREANWERVVPAYLESVRSQQSESAKSHRFAALLSELFGVEQPGFIEDYVAGVEKYVKVKGKDRILRGRIDNLFGNLVIEFERDLSKTRRDAEEQLQLYVACLWSQEAPSHRAPYLCIAADGIRFVVYSPAIEDQGKREVEPEEVHLQVVEEVGLSVLKPREVYFWLDRYFLRKEILEPTTEAIVQDFGLTSHAFRAAGQTMLSRWRELKTRSEFQVVYGAWAKYLVIVYGSSVADEELFIRHTYLSTLAKVMAWRRLTQESTSPEDDQIFSLLEGRFFKEQGIENFLEEDFFSWPVRDDAKATGVEIARQLLSLLQNYNLRELSEDVLKSLYQELVDPATRHDLGEYYTPDWLAHRMIRRLLRDNPQGTLLDPSCGSGTFLYLAVREKRERLGDTRQTLAHILDSVVGVDIHPLAVTVAKTNYILALGDLLMKRWGRVNIPIYLADAIKLPELEVQRHLDAALPSYTVELDDKVIYLPEKLLDDPTLYDDAIDAAKDFAQQSAGKQACQEEFRNYLRVQHASLVGDDALTGALFAVSQTLQDLIESGQDSIWAFILKNICKPLFLRGNFHFVLGNPPWLSFRYAAPEYQKFLRQQITKVYNLLLGRPELITHMELATLAFVRAADLYLQPGGTIAFVLPRGIFAADQHDDFRRGKFTFTSGRVAIDEVWDLDQVHPLFNVPACVLFAHKEKNPQMLYPLPSKSFRGTLPRRNASDGEASALLEVSDDEIFLSRLGKRSFWSTTKGIDAVRPSYYKAHFRNGASIQPRALWFVDVKPSSLGLNPSLPPLETAERAKSQAKGAYRGLMLKGNVESCFLYGTLLSTDVLPFAHLDYRCVVLPIEPSGENYKLIPAEEAQNRGFYHLAQWTEKAQAEWQQRRGLKAERSTALEWLDYRGKLTCQNPQAEYRVLYPKSATYLCACALENEAIAFSIGGQKVPARGFVADFVTYYSEIQKETEAHYVATVLNAPMVDSLIKPMQARGLWGPRDIHKKVLELPIPRFDPSVEAHLKLAQLGRACTQKVTDWLEAGGPGKVRSIGRLRSMVRKMLVEELREIDELLEPLLRVSGPS